MFRKTLILDNLRNSASMKFRRIINHALALHLDIIVLPHLFMNYHRHKNSQPDNGHSPLFNQLFGSVVNFFLKLLIGLIGGNKAAKYSFRQVTLSFNEMDWHEDDQLEIAWSRSFTALPGWLPEAREQRLAGLSKSTEEGFMAGKFLRKLEFDEDVEDMLDSVRKHFRAINEDDDLTAEDKQRLKTYYLEHLTTPRAKELLQKHFPEEFPTEKSAGAHPK